MDFFENSIRSSSKHRAIIDIELERLKLKFGKSTWTDLASRHDRLLWY